MLKPGVQAPDFTITLDSGDTFQLSSVHTRKHLVLYFFPKAFTRGWTREGYGFRDAYEAATELHAIVLGVSPDAIETLKRFRASCALPFLLGSDPDHHLARAYDMRRRLNLGTSRGTYVIDRHGVIRAAFHSELNMAAHARKALDVLDALNS